MPSAAPAANADLPQLKIDRLEVSLGRRRLRLDESCTLEAGRLYLVVGPSGSGKSTFARALLGFGALASPESECRGEVTLRDARGESLPVWQDETYHPAARAHIAFLPQSEKLGFIDALSVADNLSLFSHLPGETADQEIERLGRQFRLNPMPRSLASASGGERIRLSAVRGLLPRTSVDTMPEVIIADEPTSALDRLSAEAMAGALRELARSRQCIVLVITHEPELFVEGLHTNDAADSDAVRIVGCEFAKEETLAKVSGTAARLRLEKVAAPQASKWAAATQAFKAQVLAALGQLGAFGLSPIAFVWGLLGPHRPRYWLRQIFFDAIGPGTHAFSLVGCLLIAGTAAYFIFERLPKPELLDPLLLPEMMIVTGHTLVRVVLPLGACGLITTKLGAAQAARLAAAVRGGLLETLAMAGWRIESFALVPAVIAQILAMMIGTMLALVAGVVLAGGVYVAGHEDASLSLAVNLMIDGLDRAPHWTHYLLGKILVSGFLGGTIASLAGIVPSQAKDDLARAVHRTLLWSVLAVIACQCAFVIAEFRP